MKEEIIAIIEDFVDYLMPELTPSETALYLYLFRISFLGSGEGKVRIGKRKIATAYGKGIRGKRTNFGHISELLKRLEKKGCIEIGDTDRKGTFYSIRLPKSIPLVAEKMTSFVCDNIDEDYFNDPEKRREIFERDKWVCQYCGEKVTQKNATIDHFIPQMQGGKHSRENLKTCCWICNSIKSGKSYEEAAPFIVKEYSGKKSKAS